MTDQRNQIDEFWKQQASQFDEQYARKDASPLAPIVSAFLNERYRKIAPCLSARVGQRCLDVGCGSGYYAALLAHVGARVMALDYSAQMLEMAKARLGHQAVLVRGDAGCVPVISAQFDFITAVGLFCRVHTKADGDGDTCAFQAAVGVFEWFKLEIFDSEMRAGELERPEVDAAGRFGLAVTGSE